MESLVLTLVLDNASPFSVITMSCTMQCLFDLTRWSAMPGKLKENQSDFLGVYSCSELLLLIFLLIETSSISTLLCEGHCSGNLVSVMVLAHCKKKLYHKKMQLGLEKCVIDKEHARTENLSSVLVPTLGSSQTSVSKGTQISSSGAFGIFTHTYTSPHTYNFLKFNVELTT